MWNFTKDQERKLHELLPPFSNIIFNFYSKSWGSMIKVSSYLDILQDRATTNSRLLSSGFEICFVGCWHFWPGGAASGVMQTSVLGCSSERGKNLKNCSYDGSCSMRVPEHVASLPRVLGGHVAVMVRPLPPLLGWARGQRFMRVSSALWHVKQTFLWRKW